MKIKVCGMRYPDNIKELSRLPIDFMGLIFYEKSPRYISSFAIEDLGLDTVPQSIKLVGVFVDADAGFIAERIAWCGLNVIQLHGNESPEFCLGLNEKMPVIKAFSISDGSDFNRTKDYEGCCTYFLFDTKTPQYGGSGQKFDWQILNEYKGDTPFFLSGGISPDDVEAIKEIQHPKFYGIDLNSRFEAAPGLKDIEKLERFIQRTESRR